MKHFSIVLMSRSRPKMLYNLCNSISKTTTLNNEIIVGLDNDDPKLDDYIQLKDVIDGLILDIHDRNPNLHIRLNNMLNIANGKYIFVLNDDCILTSFDWDSQAFDAMESFGDIVYGRTQDNSIDKVNVEYAAFPIVSNFAAKKLGFIMDTTYGNHGSDVITYRIYKQAKKVINLDFVTVDHVFHNSNNSLQLRAQDKTAIDMINRTLSQNFSIYDLFNISVTEKSNKLI